MYNVWVIVYELIQIYTECESLCDYEQQPPQWLGQNVQWCFCISAVFSRIPRLPGCQTLEKVHASTTWRKTTSTFRFHKMDHSSLTH